MVLLLVEVVLVFVWHGTAEVDVVTEDAVVVVFVTEFVFGVGNSVGHPPSPR